MTELKPELDAPSDAELIARVRGGDTAAYGELFGRHREAADRLSRQLVNGSDSDDLVSEAFVKVLQVLQEGGGPDVAFRAYLLTAVRRLHIDRIRSVQRTQPTDDVAQYDPGIPFQDTALDGFERSVTSRAFTSLPERWQLVLWHLEVEGQKPAEIAPLLGMSPNSVSALAYRAREGLRQAYLQMHLADTPGERCRWTTEHLGAYVRGGLARRDATKVDDHLHECRRCTGLYLELLEVNSNLRGLLAPLVLGTLGPAYLTSVSSGAGTAFGFSLSGAFDRLTDGIKAMSTNAAVGGTVAAATVATGLAIAVVVTTGGPGDVRAEAPTVRPSPVASAPPDSALPRADSPGTPSPSTDRTAPDPRPSASAAAESSAAAPASPGAAATGPQSDVSPAGATKAAESAAEGSADGSSGDSGGASAGGGSGPDDAAPPRNGEGRPGRDDSGGGSDRGRDGGSEDDSKGGNPVDRDDSPGSGKDGDPPPEDGDDPPPSDDPPRRLTLSGQVDPNPARMKFDAVLTPGGHQGQREVTVELSGHDLRWIGNPKPPGWQCSPGKRIRTCSGSGDSEELPLRFVRTDGDPSFRATIKARDAVSATFSWPN